MTEQACKDYIKNHLSQIQSMYSQLVNDIGELDLNDVEFQLNRIEREFDNIYSQLKNCEDY